MSSHAATAPDVQTLDNFIGGRWVKAQTSEFFDVHNPAVGEVIGRTPLSTAADVDAAVQAATKAFPAWRDTPVNTRAQVLYKVKQLMEQHFDEMARIVTTEHGKTLDEARGSVRRGIECIEVAAGAPSLMQGFALEDIAAGIDCHVVRQPLGVAAAIAPFNVPALGGAKNFVVVMPDADLDRSMGVISESFYGCAGERCLAGSMLVPIGEVHKEARERLVESAKALKVGDGTQPGVTMGPVISAKHRERVLGYIEKGVADGAKLLVDGRQARVPDRPNGYFVGPTVFDEVSPKMAIGHEEIFGPVASICPVKTLDEAIALMKSHPNANATSIFTSSGKAAREFAKHATASMVGVNIGVAAPMAYFPFGGAKDSFFGDLKAHGRDGIEFYTDKKVTISRWF